MRCWILFFTVVKIGNWQRSWSIVTEAAGWQTGGTISLFQIMFERMLQLFCIFFLNLNEFDEKTEKGSLAPSQFYTVVASDTLV